MNVNFEASDEFSLLQIILTRRSLFLKGTNRRSAVQTTSFTDEQQDQYGRNGVFKDEFVKEKGYANDWALAYVSYAGFARPLFRDASMGQSKICTTPANTRSLNCE